MKIKLQDFRDIFQTIHFTANYTGLMTSCGEKNVPLLLNLYVFIFIDCNKNRLNWVSIILNFLRYLNQNHYTYPKEILCLMFSVAWFWMKCLFSLHFHVTEMPMPKTSLYVSFKPLENHSLPPWWHIYSIRANTVSVFSLNRWPCGQCFLWIIHEVDSITLSILQMSKLRLKRGRWPFPRSRSYWRKARLQTFQSNFET